MKLPLAILISSVHGLSASSGKRNQYRIVLVIKLIPLLQQSTPLCMKLEVIGVACQQFVYSITPNTKNCTTVALCSLTGLDIVLKHLEMRHKHVIKVNKIHFYLEFHIISVS